MDSGKPSKSYKNDCLKEGNWNSDRYVESLLNNALEKALIGVIAFSVVGVIMGAVADLLIFGSEDEEGFCFGLFQPLG